MSTRLHHQYPPSERARRLLGQEMWNLGVLDQPASDIAARGIIGSPRWFVPLNGAVMLADPAFRVLPDGRATIYAERLDYTAPRGEIWSVVVDPGQDWTTAAFTPLIHNAYHASYPFPFVDDEGRSLLTAETWKAGCAQLWEEQDGLRLLGPLLPGYQVVDPTLWRGDDGWWLFCGLHDVDPDGALFLFHAPTARGPWTHHSNNPVRTGRNGSRPAGPLFRAADGTLVRPAQDCSRTYGGAVVLHIVERLDRDGYSERILRRLDPQPGLYSAGLHTICPAGNVTLIDGKRWRLNVRSAADNLRRRVRRHRNADAA